MLSDHCRLRLYSLFGDLLSTLVQEALGDGEARLSAGHGREHVLAVLEADAGRLVDTPLQVPA